MIKDNFIFKSFINYYKNKEITITHVVKTCGIIEETEFIVTANDDDEVLKMFSKLYYLKVENYEDDYIKIIINTDSYYILSI